MTVIFPSQLKKKTSHFHGSQGVAGDPWVKPLAVRVRLHRSRTSSQPTRRSRGEEDVGCSTTEGKITSGGPSSGGSHRPKHEVPRMCQEKIGGPTRNISRWQVPWQWVMSRRTSWTSSLGRVKALQNPDGGIRGIVVGDVLRRLVARTIAKQKQGVSAWPTFCRLSPMLTRGQSCLSMGLVRMTLSGVGSVLGSHNRFSPLAVDEDEPVDVADHQGADVVHDEGSQVSVDEEPEPPTAPGPCAS